MTNTRMRSGWAEMDWHGVEDDLEMVDLREYHRSATPATSRPARPARGTDVVALRSARQRRVNAAPQRRGVPVRCPGVPVRTVLLLDVENICPASRRYARAVRELRAVLAAAGPVDEILAVASHAVTRRVGAVLAAAGVVCLPSVAQGPDSADLALIAAARRSARRGATRFVVASADHLFARVAAFGPVTVVTTSGRPVSRRLAQVADEVRVA